MQATSAVTFSVDNRDHLWPHLVCILPDLTDRQLEVSLSVGRQKKSILYCLCIPQAYFITGDLNTVVLSGNISARSVKPEESNRDALNAEDKKKKLQQTELVPRSESAVGAASATPMKILKTESTFAKTFGQRGPNKEKKITFADEHGRSIADNTYVEQLHYSTASYNSAEMQKGCCTIS